MEDVWDFDETWSCFAYNDIIQHWILKLKFYGKEHLSQLLGRLLALNFQNNNWLVKYFSLIQIPIYSSPLRNGCSIRPYYLQINLEKSAPELQTYWLRHLRATRPQSELPLAEIVVNLDDTFEASFQVSNHQILLMDDVMTIGYKLNTVAKCLKEAAVYRVGALVLWAGGCGIQLRLDLLRLETQKIKTNRPSKKVYRALLHQLVFQQSFLISCPIEHIVPGCLINQKASFGIQMNY